MNIWFTSDPHWGHRFVAGIREFDTPEDHDAALLEAYHEHVKARDSVWWLGDLTVSSPKHGLEMVAKVPGRHHLIWGNHDNGHPMHRDSYRRQAQYREVFDSQQPFIRKRIEGREYLLSHFPYAGDHTEVERYDQYRLRDQGLPLVHGHTHSTETISFSPSGTLQVHVGVDAWFRPVHVDEIDALFRKHIIDIQENE